ncbi:glycoside hydrolase family protein [Caballeronia sp. GAFFF2]|uniref:glycoside hydrolase family protein n=1 Tax=Caballeronia sp. GAFFF2 TaxID=2921741 RepID=UPI002028E0C3|nr:glycoside hydrolase family protein [Caballeronia sp. GAFFF2]
MSWLDAILALFKPKQQGGGYQPLPTPEPLPPPPAPTPSAPAVALSSRLPTITPQNEMQLVDELRRDEGVKYTRYLDSKGIPTTGVGHNLNAKPLPAGWTYPLSDSQVDQLLEDDLDDVYVDLDRNLSWWRALDDVRQRVIANMCFNMGIGRLLGFTKMLAAARTANYSTAAAEMLDSKWAREDVGIGTAAKPGRALRLANMMRDGK